MREKELVQILDTFVMYIDAVQDELRHCNGFQGAEHIEHAREMLIELLQRTGYSESGQLNAD